MNAEVFLVQRVGYTALSAFRLQSGELIVGRSSRADICIPDVTVSRKHARIEVAASHITIYDLQSRNGTFVDEQQVQSSPIQLGDNVRFGSVRLLVAATPNGLLDAGSQIETTELREARRERLISAAISPELTPAQRRVFELLLKGDLEKQVAHKLGISQHTVHNHAREIYRVYQVHSRAELLLRVFPHEHGQPTMISEPY